GELLREILRKVANTEDVGLSDYELRDLNERDQQADAREEALGGANYRWNDDDGKAVLGTKGYKCVYYSSPPEPSGVRELFQSRKTAKEEAKAALEF
ncbi:hypothetical protein K438DRAFT_1587370, partial [Mycena galopus ATCC 62051]